MNRAELAVCRIKEKLPGNQGFITKGSGCVVHCETIASSWGWKCQNFIVSPSIVLCREDFLTPDKTFIVEFLSKDKKGLETFELKLLEEVCKDIPGRSLNSLNLEQKEQSLSFISVEPLDKRGFLKKMVKKSTLQTFRPLECFDFERNKLEDELREGLYCHVIVDLFQCEAANATFSTRTLKINYDLQTGQFSLQDFGGSAKTFEKEEHPIGAVIYTKKGEFVGLLDFVEDVVSPVFLPESAIAEIGQNGAAVNNNSHEIIIVNDDSTQSEDEQVTREEDAGEQTPIKHSDSQDVPVTSRQATMEGGVFPTDSKDVAVQSSTENVVQDCELRDGDGSQDIRPEEMIVVHTEVDEDVNNGGELTQEDTTDSKTDNSNEMENVDCRTDSRVKSEKMPEIEGKMSVENLEEHAGGYSSVLPVNETCLPIPSCEINETDIGLQIPAGHVQPTDSTAADQQQTDLNELETTKCETDLSSTLDTESLVTIIQVGATCPQIETTQLVDGPREETQEVINSTTSISGIEKLEDEDMAATEESGIVSESVVSVSQDKEDSHMEELHKEHVVNGAEVLDLASTESNARPDADGLDKMKEECTEFETGPDADGLDKMNEECAEFETGPDADGLDKMNEECTEFETGPDADGLDKMNEECAEFKTGSDADGLDKVKTECTEFDTGPDYSFNQTVAEMTVNIEEEPEQNVEIASSISDEREFHSEEVVESRVAICVTPPVEDVMEIDTEGTNTMTVDESGSKERLEDVSERDGLVEGLSTSDLQKEGSVDETDETQTSDGEGAENSERKFDESEAPAGSEELEGDKEALNIETRRGVETNEEMEVLTESPERPSSDLQEVESTYEGEKPDTVETEEMKATTDEEALPEARMEETAQAIGVDISAADQDEGAENFPLEAIPSSNVDASHKELQVQDVPIHPQPTADLEHNESHDKEVLDLHGDDITLQRVDADSLLTDTITNNLQVLRDLGQCLDTEYQYGRVPCWRDLAELLDIPPEAYEHCAAFSQNSPTEDLFAFLGATKPQLTIMEVKEALTQIERPEVAHLLERKIGSGIFSDESFVGSLVDRDDTDILGQIAVRLDKKCRNNWKPLALQLNVPRRVFRNFGSLSRHNPALMLLKFIPIFDPELTVKDLKDSLDSIQRNDVMEILNEAGIPGDEQVKDILDDTDLLDQLTDLLNEDSPPCPCWWQLARKLNIPDEKHKIFEPAEDNHSPTTLLFKSVEKCEPDLTFEELILALVAMKRQDVLDVLQKYFSGDDINQILEENNLLAPVEERLGETHS